MVTGAFAGLIAGVCYNGGEGHHPLSGQAFTSDQGGYNVVVAFCDSNDPPDTAPSAYTPPGPDGPGNVYCGGNDADACDIGTCNPDTLVVNTLFLICSRGTFADEHFPSD
ncbi:hypothetical protein LTR37_002012 [Vermiconidia calcicola]|uniref:Uncharacterized protein n=1 Tax=Vermiconidia calcicola TaxID=1690605 RepID=A0ACC3NUT4_9PEZI|nr:hypothetical protein LTR37_002012 [Vermiconidia calcicola]